MKTVPAQTGWRLLVANVDAWVRAATARLFTRDGSPSVDGLDAAIRGFGVAIVLLLSAFGYGIPAHDSFLKVADPLLVAAALVVYNLLVIAVVGVPWRHTPGFALFVLDWL